MTPYSLRRRLQSWLVAAVALVWIGIAAATYLDARRELNVLLDAHLAQSAQLLITQSGHELQELDSPDLREVIPYSQKVIFQIWDPRGVLIFRSSDAPAGHLSDLENGFADSVWATRRWRVFSGWNQDHSVLVQIAEDRAPREKLAARIAVNALLPLLAGLPLLAALISWIVTRALQPLTALGHEVGARSAAALLPIEATAIPAEAAPLLARLNELFDRVRRLLESERLFTSNAAHELRNPLAALRAQAEVAADSSDPVVARTALRRVISACDHLTRIVQQLLLLARIDEKNVEPAALSLDALARRVLAEAASDALARGSELALDAPDPLLVQGHADLLEILLRNLVDNALRHGGDGISVVVTVRASGTEALLTVSDSGAGVDSALRPQLGRRFFRPQQTRGEGSGLGLSLVQRIVELHGGTVSYQEGERGRGLSVQVRLPRARALISNP